MNITFYIQKKVWEKFKEEKNKSALINMLLRVYYGMEDEK